MSKLLDSDLNNLIEIIKKNKASIFLTTDDIDKKRHDLINSFKETPELLITLLNQTTKPYKNIKDVKSILISAGFTKQLKDSTIKFLLENIDFN